MGCKYSGVANKASFWCLVVLLIGHIALLAYGSWQQSPTLNEPGHLVAGLHHWKNQDFTLYRVNPPLIRLTAAARLQQWSTVRNGQATSSMLGLDLYLTWQNISSALMEDNRLHTFG